MSRRVQRSAVLATKWASLCLAVVVVYFEHRYKRINGQLEPIACAHGVILYLARILWLSLSSRNISVLQQCRQCVRVHAMEAIGIQMTQVKDVQHGNWVDILQDCIQK